MSIVDDLAGVELRTRVTSAAVMMPNAGRLSANHFTPRTLTKPELTTKTGISVSHLDITLWTR